MTWRRVRPAERLDLDGDELFTPTLAGHDAAVRVGGRRPWRLGSQLFVGFFGGVLAGAAIAIANGVRLGLSRGRLAFIGVVAIAVLVVSAVVDVALDVDTDLSTRTTMRVGGVLGFLVFYAVQRPADRHYQAYRARGDDNAYDSLWGPGILATILLGAAQVLLTAGLLGRL